MPIVVKHSRRPFLVGVLVGALFALTSVAQAQVTIFDIFKNVEYQQTSGMGTPSLFGYFFNSRTFFTNPGDFDKDTLTYPGAGSPLDVPLASATHFFFATPYLTQADLDAQFPFGDYTSTAENTGTSATETHTQTYSAHFYSSAIPTLSDTAFNALQGLDPASGITIDWNAFPGEGAPVNAQGIFFRIYDTATFTDIFSQIFLPVSTNSVFLPGNTLQPNTSYQFELIFSNRINDGVLVQGFDNRTFGDFRTSVSPVPEPGSLALLGISGIGISLLALRRRRIRR